MQDSVVKDVRIALGGVAHKPWRASAAEAALRGGPATEAALSRRGARRNSPTPRRLRDNAFKIELAQRVIVDRWSA